MSASISLDQQAMLPGDVLVTAYLARDRYLAAVRGDTLPDRTSGAALFADIFGFTPLTEALARALGPRLGAEELTHRLNQVYDALIAEVDRYAGSVVNFAGDAITCWFDDHGPALASSSHRAAACALAIQEAMQAYSHLAVSSGETIALAVKIAIATGPARRFVVGDEKIQLLDVLAGATLSRMAAGEHLADKGQVLADEATVTRLGAGAAVREWRTDEAGTRFAVLAGLTPVPDSPWPPAAVGPLPAARLAHWLLPAVYARLQAGAGEFLTELRPVVALFLSFAGIDYDQDEHAGDRLDSYVRWVQRVLAQYDGALLDLTIGDKGSYLYAALGALVAHEDNARRAANAALELRFPPAELGFTRATRIGVSQGVMRVGAYGSSTRRTYGALGDEVNVAARLMQAAQPGQILVGRRAQRDCGPAFQWQSLPPVSVKGKHDPIAVMALLGAAPRGEFRLSEPRYTQPLIGREGELGLILDRLERSRQGQGQIIGLIAEAGMGKSRLAAQVAGLAGERGISGYGGACQSFGTNTPYLVWRDTWRGLFGLDDSAAMPEQVRALQQSLGKIEPSFVQRAPLLGIVLDLPIPDNDLTRSFDARLRKESLETLLVDCLQARAAGNPLLLVLEDLHWMDPLSHDLLEAIGRITADLPVLILFSSRPLDTERLQALRIAAMAHYSEVRLSTLPHAEAVALAAARLGADVAAPVLDTLVARAEGNPFYLEELILYLLEQGLDPGDSRAVAGLDWPASLHSLLLARIDQLTERQRTVLKVASIIGRRFRLGELAGVYPELGAPELVRADLDVLEQVQLTLLDTPEPERAYLFKHIITQEVTYATLAHTLRAQLHERFAAWLEASTAAAGSPLPLDLLAHHYGRSTNAGKNREYAERAGEAALQAGALEAAGAYYTQALSVTPEESPAARFALLLPREQVYHLRGLRELQIQDLDALQRLAGRPHPGDAPGAAPRRQSEVLRRRADCSEMMSDFRAALTAAEQAVALALEAGATELAAQGYVSGGRALMRLGNYGPARVQFEQALALARSKNDGRGEAEALQSLGETARFQGDYAAAQSYLAQALALSRTLGDRRGEGLALNVLGTVAALQGDSTAAQAHFEQSLVIRQAIGDRQNEAGSLNNLGIVAMYRGDNAAARAYYEAAMAIHRATGNRSGEGSSLHNLGIVANNQGDYAAARAYYEQALTIRRTVGDRQGEGQTLNNLGMVAGAQGDYAAARDYDEQSLEIRRAIGDRQGEGTALDSLGRVAQAQGDYAAARAYYEQALEIRCAIGDRQGEGYGRHYLGTFFLHLGDYAAARESLARSLAILRTAGERQAEGAVMHSLSVLAYQEGNLAEARTWGEQAVQLAREIEAHDTLVSALVNLGHVLTDLELLAEAKRAYEEALPLQRTLGRPHLELELLAGRARVAWRSGEPALPYVEEVLSKLEGQALPARDVDLFVYLACYQVLNAYADSRADPLLRQACAELQDRAARLDDEAMRRRYLEGAPLHRALLAAAGPGCAGAPQRPNTSAVSRSRRDSQQ